MRLEHRDVLVRGGMEDDGRAVLLEHLAPHDRAFLDVDELRHGGGELPLLQLLLDLEERPLGVVDEDEPRRADPGDLPTELRADRSACPRNEHRLAFEVRRDFLEVDLDLLAAEDVLHLDGPNLAGEPEVAGDELVRLGRVLTGTFACCALSTIRRRTSPETDGIAMSNSSGRWSRSTCGRSSSAPRTRTPMIRECCLRGSSSTKPIGV